MTDTVVPKWIRELEVEHNRLSAESRAKSLDAALTDKIIRADGPTYWRQLQKELYIAVEALERLGITGAVLDAYNVNEKGVQVKIRLVNRPTRQAYVNLFYNEGESAIRRYPTSADGASQYPFDVQDGSIALFGDMDTLNPESAARFILEPMVKSLKL